MTQLKPFFSPNSIAIVGASKNPQKGGYVILQNIIRGFRGEIYPVNPKYPEIEGIKCFSSIEEIPSIPELAIVFVPPERVGKVVRDLGVKGTKGVIIESGGFAETGEKGRNLQKELLRISQKYHIRLWGPNCMGIVDTHRSHVFSFVSPTIWEWIYPGDISFIVQSGMLSAGFLIDILSHGKASISKACSIGNRIDVEECELIKYLIEDNTTKVIALYLESLSSPSNFLSLSKNSPKPIVILQGGKTEQGAKAALTHTASIAQDYVLLSSLFKQGNLIEAHTFSQLINHANILSCYQDINISPQENYGVAIITYSGGAGIVNSDLLKHTCLSLSDLSSSTLASLKRFYPSWMRISNPVDVWPAVEKSGMENVYKKGVEIILKDEKVSGIFLHIFTSSRFKKLDLDYLKHLSNVYNKPIFIWIIGERENVHSYLIEGRNLGLPIFPEIKEAVDSAHVLFNYLKRKDKKPSLPASQPPFQYSSHPLEIPSTIEIQIKRNNKILDEYESNQLLKELNISTPPSRVISSIHEAISFTEKVGYPVVLKGLIPGITHKTEANLIEKGICSAEDLAKKFNSLKGRLKKRGRIIIQKMLPIDMEFICSATKKESFPLLVLFGFGGTLAEVLDDRVIGFWPFNEKEAREILRGLKNYHLLKGIRNIPPVNIEELARIFTSLGNICSSISQLKEIEINPLAWSKGKLVAVDCVVVIE